MEEVWKDIPGYEHRYQASTLGRIRSLDRIITNSKGVDVLYKGQVLKTHINSNGYVYAAVGKELGKIISKRVHRLVAKTFIPNPNNYPQINHKDENPMNNCVDNLEWCSRSYNNTYGHRMEKFKKVARNHPSYSKEVNQYDLEGNYITSFPSAREAADKLNINKKTGGGCIAECCRNTITNGRSAYGYLWRFSSECAKGESIEGYRPKKVI